MAVLVTGKRPRPNNREVKAIVYRSPTLSGVLYTCIINKLSGFGIVK